MMSIKEKLHELIDKTNDPIILENLYGMLNQIVDNQKADILDELSTSQLNSLHESMAQYRRGEVRSHEEILQMLREWRSK